MRRRSFGRASVMVTALSALLLLVPTAALHAKSLAEELEGDSFLPIGMSAAELEMLDRIGERHRSTPPATGPVRQPGEFEPMTGVIVRYPWGNPTNLLAEYSEDITLWVIVEDAGDQSSASSSLSAAGANMANVDWIFAPTNSIWTRDYGPWFIIDGNGDQGISRPHTTTARGRRMTSFRASSAPTGASPSTGWTWRQPAATTCATGGA